MAEIEQITRPMVLGVLMKHIGKARGIDITGLVREARVAAGVYGGPITEGQKRRVRKLLEELRRNGHHVCATPADGYYIAANTQELQETCRFLFDRAMTSLTQVAAMKRVSLPDLEGQLRLRT